MGTISDSIAVAASTTASGGLGRIERWACTALIAGAIVSVAQAQPRRDARRTVPLTETAATMALRGFAQGDARTILAAARIMAVVEQGSPRVRPLGRDPGPAGPWDGALSRRSLLLLSSRVAADNGDWLIADLAANELAIGLPVPVDSARLPTRGAAGGPIWADAFLAAGGEKAYEIEFEGGGAPNLVQISAGKPAAMLECLLLDPTVSDRPAVRVRSVSGSCTLQWQQSMQGKVILRIRNRGPDAFYVLSSN